MTSLLADERGGLQADEMTFSNIAGVLPAVDKVKETKKTLFFTVSLSFAHAHSICSSAL